jgi:hypothetical protein
MPTDPFAAGQLPSAFAEAQPLPAVQRLLREQVDMQLADMRQDEGQGHGHLYPHRRPPGRSEHADRARQAHQASLGRDSPQLRMVGERWARLVSNQRPLAWEEAYSHRRRSAVPAATSHVHNVHAYRMNNVCSPRNAPLALMPGRVVSPTARPRCWRHALARGPGSDLDLRSGAGAAEPQSRRSASGRSDRNP